MNTATVITGWKGTGTASDPYRPALAADHPVQAWSDATKSPGGQGASYTVQVNCDDATLAAIQADPKYAGKVTVLGP